MSKLYEENTTVRRGQTRLLIEKRSTDQRLNTSREENAKLRTQLSELQKANDRLNSAARQVSVSPEFTLYCHFIVALLLLEYTIEICPTKALDDQSIGSRVPSDNSSSTRHLCFQTFTHG